MKTQSGSRIGNVFKTIFNFRWWIDYDRLKQFTIYLINGFKKFFIPQKNRQINIKFEEVMQKYNLTEEELIARWKGLHRLSMITFTFAVLIFAYALYHLFTSHLSAALISLIASLIALVFSFRYSFWSYQIKERRLGCTIREWYKNGLLGEKNE